MCISVNEKTNSVNINLSKDFYSSESIDKAIGLCENAEFTKKDTDKHYLVSIKPSEKIDLRKTALEFCNLLIAASRGKLL